MVKSILIFLKTSMSSKMEFFTALSPLVAGVCVCLCFCVWLTIKGKKMLENLGVFLYLKSGFVFILFLLKMNPDLNLCIFWILILLFFFFWFKIDKFTFFKKKLDANVAFLILFYSSRQHLLCQQCTPFATSAFSVSWVTERTKITSVNWIRD